MAQKQDRTEEVNAYEIVPSFTAEQLKELEEYYTDLFTEFERSGKFETTHDMETFNAFSLSMPRELHNIATIMTRAKTRLTNMQRQIDKMHVTLARTIRTKFNEVMDGKTQLKAYLTVDHYDNAIIEFNKQTLFIEYLDNVMAQLRYINQHINARLEMAKFRREQGY